MLDRGRRAAAGLVLAALGCKPASPPLVDDVVVTGEVAREEPPPPRIDELPPPGHEPGPPRWTPTAIDPRLVVRDGGAELGFVEEPCAYGDDCGCMVPTEHRYTRRGKGWQVVVITPQVEIRRLVVRGTCVVSCGRPAPPEPRPIRSLGAVAPGDVEIVDRRPREVLRIRTCTDPMPRP